MLAPRLLALCLVLIPATALAADDPYADTREALIVTPQEKAYILGQMRLFVATVQSVAEGLATDAKSEAIDAATARRARRNANAPDFPATLNAKLPVPWKTFGNTMRKGFDTLATDLAQDAPPRAALTTLGALMRNCVACHASYRLQDAGH